MAERSNAAVLKTVELRGSGGSNPSFSATTTYKRPMVSCYVLERCRSGRTGRSRKPLYWVTGTEGSNPSLSAGKKRISKQKPVGQHLQALLFVRSDELKSGLNYLLGGVSGGGDLVVLKSPPIGMLHTPKVCSDSFGAIALAPI